MEIDAWMAWAEQAPVGWGLTALGASAGIEYVFPPFPGDTITVLGAVLTAHASWPVIGVFTAVMLGSMAGAALNVVAGRWLASSERDTFLHRWLRRPAVAERIQAVLGKFERHGAAYIMLNRFLPAFRSILFLAAGMARLPVGRVLLYAAVSSALWNVLLMGAGYAVGFHLDALLGIVRTYSVIVLSTIIGLVTLLVGRKMWQKRSSQDRFPPGDDVS